MNEQELLESLVSTDNQVTTKVEQSKVDIKQLSSIFNEEVLKVLTLEDFTKPLAEVLNKLIGGTQVVDPILVEEYEDKVKLTLTYNLSDVVLKDKLESFTTDKYLNLSISKKETDWKVHYLAEVPKEEKAKYYEILSNNYKEVSGVTIEKFDDTSLNEELLSYQDQQMPVSCLAEGKSYRLKVPIAKRGKFYHPEYKVLDFSEEVLENIKSNIENNVVGYPIPITIGHQDDKASKEGELVNAYLEEDILFGEWEVKKDTYRKVEDGDITFSSAEFFPNYFDKKTGESKGRALFGMALTNRPYIPDQPRVITLSDSIDTEKHILSSQVKLSELQYTQREILTNEGQSMSEEKEKEVLVESTTQFSDQIKVLQEQLSDYQIKLSEVENTYKEKLSEQQVINEQLQSKIEKYETRIKEEELNAKLNYLSELKLPKEIHEKYTELIKNGSLGESEETVLTSLAQLASLNNKELFSQFGYTKSTADLNSETYADPYAKVIEYNKKIAEAKKQQMLTSL